MTTTAQNAGSKLSDESSPRRPQSSAEELANALTHGLGAALAIAALVVLVVLASIEGDAWRIVSFSIYGATLVTLYLASTLYHSFSNPRVKKILRVIDHTSINLLIAGTYTPIVLVTLRGPWGWTLFGIIWGLAVAGIFRDIFLPRFLWLAIALYVGMGWLALIAIDPLLRHAGGWLLLWMVVGGLFYTLGIAFYVWKSLRFHHAIWHLFVLGGSIAHFIGILLFSAPII